MPARRKPPISDAERDVLKALWEHGPGTVRELNHQLAVAGRRWAYTTVITLLQRLEAKGYVSSDKAGAAHVFRASTSRQDVVRARLADLADQYCEGDATPLVLALVQDEKFSEEDLAGFRRLIDKVRGQKKQG
jgi:predicted transcriptional regulator